MIIGWPTYQGMIEEVGVDLIQPEFELSMICSEIILWNC